jgi:hypothetical protein
MCPLRSFESIGWTPYQDTLEMIGMVQKQSGEIRLKRIENESLSPLECTTEKQGEATFLL